MSTIDYIITGLGSALGLALLVAGYFHTTTMQQLNTTVASLTTEVSALKEDRKAQSQLNDFLSKRLDTVEEENSTFRRIIGSLDKIIYSKLGIDLHNL